MARLVSRTGIKKHYHNTNSIQIHKEIQVSTTVALLLITEFNYCTLKGVPIADKFLILHKNESILDSVALVSWC